MNTSRLESFFFRPSSVYPLAVCRLIFFGWLFLWYLRFDFTAIAYYPPEIWRPLHLLRWLRLDFIPSESALATVQLIWKGSLFLACIGLLSRLSAGVACALGAYLLVLTHSFYKINHSDGLLVLAMLVLAFSRAGDALSIDALLRRRNASPPAASGEYTWPFQAIRLAWVCLFFGSGISKLLVGGLDWMFTNNLYNIVVYCALTRDPLLDLNIHWPLFYNALAVATVTFEILAPLALLGGRIGGLIVLTLLGMQIGIRLTMGDNFTQFMALYLFWLPWTALAALALKRKRPTSHEAEVLTQPSIVTGVPRKA